MQPLKYGRLTQLVECHLYTVEVTGSSPVSPTIILLKFFKLVIKLSHLSDKFDYG